MAKLEAENKGDRENSLYASVELSLRRLPDEVRQRVNRLAVVHGGGHAFVLRQVMGVDNEGISTIANMLIDTGMAELLDYNYLRLDPALPAYLQLGMEQETFAQLEWAWAEAMQQLVSFLYQQRSQDSVLASKLTLFELPNLLALVDWLADLLAQDGSSAETVSDIAGKIEQLLANLNRPSALAKAMKLREESAGKVPEWGKTRFQSAALEVERLLAAGQLQPAYEKASALLEKAKTATYPGADFDLAMAHSMLGQVLRDAGQAASALETYTETLRLFEAIGERGERMASVTLTEQADCLTSLGRLDEAAEKYEERIRRGEKLKDYRGVAVGKGQLATVHMYQKKYAEALAEYQSSLEIFEKQDEPAHVATSWHGIGWVYLESENYEQAEVAYRNALTIETKSKNKQGEAKILNELGNLYNDKLNRPEEAVTFYRKAADIAVETGDLAKEGLRRNNIANTLRKLKRYDEARAEIMRAIECNKPFGHVSEPWKTFSILRQIEEATGNPTAARVAWEQARDAYLAYRRQGGYAQTPGGRLVDQILGLLQEGKAGEAVQFLTQVSQSPDTENWLKVASPKYLAVLQGSRDRALADDNALDYDDAAEVLFLLERLGG
jgi:tetratricopeptide (TPR) repeat protein